MKKIKYTGLKDWKYRLVKDYSCKTGIKGQHLIISKFVYLDYDGILYISEGYCWDGASGPAIDTKSIMRGSLVHDSLYQLMRAGLLSINYRKLVDKLLRKICIEDGMFRIRAWYVYHAVRKFSGKYAMPQDSEPKIRYAP